MYGTPQLGRLRGGTYSYATPLSRRSRRLLSRFSLGALTPDQAAQQAMPTSSIRNTAGFTQTVYNDIVAAAAAGNFTAFNPSGCQGIHPLAPAITAVAGGFALKFAGAAGPAAPVVAAIGGALEVFSAIFAKHAAAVAKEQQVVCAAVPAASDSLSAIDAAVQNATFTPQQGIQALQQLLSSFQGQVASIVKNSASQCNAACVWTKMLTAIVAIKSSQYQDLANQAAAATSTTPAGTGPGSITTTLAPVTNLLAPISSAVQSAGLPAWVLPAGLFFVLWEVL